MDTKKIEFDSEGKYIAEGIAKTLPEMEVKQAKRTKLYNVDAIKTALTTGKAFVFGKDATLSTIFKAIHELYKEKGFENITYGKVKGSAHTLTTKNEKTYTNYQFFLYLGTEKFVPRKVSKKKKN